MSISFIQEKAFEKLTDAFSYLHRNAGSCGDSLEDKMAEAGKRTGKTLKTEKQQENDRDHR